VLLALLQALAEARRVLWLEPLDHRLSRAQVRQVERDDQSVAGKGHRAPSAAPRHRDGGPARRRRVGLQS
jgi:hypothetical protein